MTVKMFKASQIHQKLTLNSNFSQSYGRQDRSRAVLDLRLIVKIYRTNTDTGGGGVVESRGSSVRDQGAPILCQSHFAGACFTKR